MNTNEPILQELNQRKSIRSFAPKEIEPEKLKALWAAAQWAPSSSNKQEWHYYAVMGAAREKFATVLNPGNHWALQAPLLLAVARDTSIPDQTESREYGMYNVALSVMSLAVEAEHQGLKTHQMAGFKEEEEEEEEFRTVLNVPEKYAPVVMVAVGYEAALEDIDPTIREKEMRPRTRKPIEEVVEIITAL